MSEPTITIVAPKAASRKRLFAALASVIVLAAVAATVWFGMVWDAEPGDDANRMQGEWGVMTTYDNPTAPVLSPLVVRVNKDRWTYVSGGKETRSYRMTLNPAAHPREIDLNQLLANGELVSQDASKPVGLHGSYEFQGKTVQVVLAPMLKPRPKSSADPDRPQVLVLRRKEP